MHTRAFIFKLAALFTACGPEPADPDDPASSSSSDASSGASMSSGPGIGLTTGAHLDTSGEALTTGALDTSSSGEAMSSGPLDTTGEGGTEGAMDDATDGGSTGDLDTTGGGEPLCVGEPCGPALPPCQRGTVCIMPDPRDDGPRCFALCDPADLGACHGMPALCDVVVIGAATFCEVTVVTCN